MPPVHRDGPQLGTEGHPDALNATTTANITRSPVRGGRQQVPIAPASVFGPVGRAKTLDAVAGERKAGCGHRVQIMAARIYSQPESGAAA